MSVSKSKILVHTCCASCASYVFPELIKANFIVIAYFYNPEVHGRAEYIRRLNDLKKYCESDGHKLIIPEYNIQDYFGPLLPYQDKNSIKFINDKKRYKRKRCQLCLSTLMERTAMEAKKMKIKNFTSTMLCSPYKDHNEIWDKGLVLAGENKLNFYYQDFRKGYWKGRNYGRSHYFNNSSYCGCSESLEEGILE